MDQPGAGNHGRRNRWATRAAVAGITVACGAGLAGVALVDRQIAAAVGDRPGNDSHGLRGFEDYTEPGGIWPPRQTEIVADAPAPTRIIPTPEAEVGELAPGEAASDPQQARLTVALGERFERVASGPEIDAKGRPVGERIRTTYFSYSANATIAVIEDEGRIVSIETAPAAQYQPPRTEAEQERAVALARRALTDAGHDRAGQIEGYAILAFPHPDNDLPDPGTPHFDGRVLYVSFHIDPLSDPEFAAWVDLTDERVLRAEAAS